MSRHLDVDFEIQLGSEKLVSEGRLTREEVGCPSPEALHCIDAGGGRVFRHSGPRGPMI